MHRSRGSYTFYHVVPKKTDSTAVLRGGLILSSNHRGGRWFDTNARPASKSEACVSPARATRSTFTVGPSDADRDSDQQVLICSGTSPARLAVRGTLEVPLGWTFGAIVNDYDINSKIRARLGTRNRHGYNFPTGRDSVRRSARASSVPPKTTPHDPPHPFRCEDQKWSIFCQNDDYCVLVQSGRSDRISTALDQSG